MPHLGIRYTPMHPLSAEDDHVDIVLDCEATVLIVDGGGYEERALAIRARTPQVTVVSIGPAADFHDIMKDFAVAAAVRPSELVGPFGASFHAYQRFGCRLTSCSFEHRILQRAANRRFAVCG